MQMQSGAMPADGRCQGEYLIIIHDLARVIILNLIYLAAVLAIYFSNQKTHYLEVWFAKILHF